MTQPTRTRLLAPLGAAILLVLAAPAVEAAQAASGPISAPAALNPQARAALLSQLDARRAERGLDGRHGFAILAQHPGFDGTQVARVAHTFKGVPIFGSE